MGFVFLEVCSSPSFHCLYMCISSFIFSYYIISQIIRYTSTVKAVFIHLFSFLALVLFLHFLIAYYQYQSFSHPFPPLGALLASPLEENKPPAMNGSAMLAVAETAEEVIEHLKHDVYCTSGVWDIEKVQIYPVSFVPCMRFLSGWGRIGERGDVEGGHG